MIPLDGLAPEDEGDDDGEYREGNHFLDNLQLHQVEGAAVSLETNAVGGHGEAILKEGNAPGEKDDEDERPAGGDFHFLQFEVTVPGERHEHVRKDEHKDGPKAVHTL